MSAICADRLVDSSMATSFAVPSGAAFRDPPNRLHVSHRQAKHHAVEYRMVVSGTRSGVFSDAMHVSDNHLRVCKRQATTIVDFILLTSLFTAPSISSGLPNTCRAASSASHYWGTSLSQPWLSTICRRL